MGLQLEATRVDGLWRSTRAWYHARSTHAKERQARRVALRPAVQLGVLYISSYCQSVTIAWTVPPLAGLASRAVSASTSRSPTFFTSHGILFFVQFRISNHFRFYFLTLCLQLVEK